MLLFAHFLAEYPGRLATSSNPALDPIIIKQVSSCSGDDTLDVVCDKVVYSKFDRV